MLGRRGRHTQVAQHGFVDGHDVARVPGRAVNDSEVKRLRPGLREAERDTPGDDRYRREARDTRLCFIEDGTALDEPCLEQKRCLAVSYDRLLVPEPLPEPCQL